MTDHIDPAVPQSLLDELCSELLSVGAVLSQIVAQMVRFEAQGRSAPDAAPIPEAAHALLRDALGELEERHSAEDLRATAAIIRQATDSICNEVFFVAPDLDLN